MKYWYTNEEGTLLNVGDTVAPGKVVAEMGRLNLYTKDSEDSPVYAGRCSFGINRLPYGIKYHESPSLALYDRITGKRIKDGESTPNYRSIKIDAIYTDCVRLKLANGEYEFLNREIGSRYVELGLELRCSPEFADLYQLPRTTRRGMVYVKDASRRNLPAEDAIYIKDKYRPVCEYKPLCNSMRYVKIGTEGMVELACGRMVEKEYTAVIGVGASKGMIAFVYDVVPVGDTFGLPNELAQVRTREGLRYAESVPEGLALTDGIPTEEDAIFLCAGTGEPGWVVEAKSYDNKLYSKTYYEEYIRSCSECGNYFVASLSSDCECSGCRTSARLRVRNYTNRAANGMTPEKDVPIKFGIELEVGCDRGYSKNNCVKVMADAIDLAIGDVTKYAAFKNDGSIDDCNGYEIVTRPDCPSVHKRVWKTILEQEKVRTYMSSFSNKKCGIHIHVSRAPLSKLWIGRMLVLINSPKMLGIVTTVAQRPGNNYTRFKDKSLTDGVELSPDRYEALNTCNEHTIEFRIFRGTLHGPSFLKNIEFVQAVLEYCRPSERSMGDVDDPAKFLDFVKKSKKSYPNLFAYLRDKKAYDKSPDPVTRMEDGEEVTVPTSVTIPGFNEYTPRPVRRTMPRLEDEGAARPLRFVAPYPGTTMSVDLETMYRELQAIASPVSGHASRVAPPTSWIYNTP